MRWNAGVILRTCCKSWLPVLIVVFLIGQSNLYAGSGVEGVFAIKASKIVSVSGGVIENGVIIIRDGIIETVGKDIDIPVEAELIEADSMIVYPGFIDAHTSIALKKPKKKPDENNRASMFEAKPSPYLCSPEKQAIDLLDPKDAKISQYRNLGVTTVLTIPDEGIFIGQSALINLNDGSPEEMVLKSPVALHIGYSRQRGVYPSTLMGVVAYQRQTFYDAQYHRMLLARYAEQKKGWRRPELNRSLEAIIPVLTLQLPLIISANSENDIIRALKLADEFQLNCIISGAVEGWRVVDRLKTNKNPVLLSLDFPKPEEVTGYSFQLKVEGPVKSEAKSPQKKTADSSVKNKKKEKDNDKEKADLYANAGVLHNAGIMFAFASEGMKNPDDFIKNVMKTIEYGLPREEALKALTIYPAQIFGVDEQVGSIEEGKIANLFIATGDIFNEKSKIRYVFVDGKKFEIEEKKKGEAPAVDVTGTWEAVVFSPQGEVAATLELSQSGSVFSGELQSQFGESSFSNGTVNGNQIEFSVKLSIGGQPVELFFSGTVSENHIEGTIDLGEMGKADWNATKPGKNVVDIES